MKNCTEFIDSISAYADGELTGSEKLSVEDHLAGCENCSAILEVYREISISVEESGINPPEALRIGVMNRVMSEKVFHIPETEKKRRRFQFALTRFAPIAACLVVMLLVWQFWGNTWNTWGGSVRTSNDAAAPQAAMPAGSGGGATTTTSGTTMPDAAPVPEAAADEAWSADDMDMAGSRIALSEAEAAGGFSDGGASVADAPVADAPVALNEQDNLMMEGESRSPEETERIMAFLGGAYAEVTMTGELPAFLDGIEPLPFGSWFGWQMVFEIPHSEYNVIIEEIGGRDNVVIQLIPGNRNSTYIIVYFSHGN